MAGLFMDRKRKFLLENNPTNVLDPAAMTEELTGIKPPDNANGTKKKGVRGVRTQTQHQSNSSRIGQLARV